jgi:hypothetical protein
MIYAIAVALVLVLATVNGEQATPTLLKAFEAFMEKYGKVYASPAEMAKRLEVFAANLEKSNKMNAQHLLLNGEAVFGITKFSDLTSEEFQAQYLNYKPLNRSDAPVWEPSLTTVASEVNWVEKGMTTPVKDQGRCGSCWAFGATEAIESYGAITGKYDLLELAPQQITSCDYTSYGCRGGWAEHAMQYVIDAGGIMLEEDYPYTSGASGYTGTCKADKSLFASSISSCSVVRAGEDNREKALNGGPRPYASLPPPSRPTPAASLPSVTTTLTTACRRWVTPRTTGSSATRGTPTGVRRAISALPVAPISAESLMTSSSLPSKAF